MSDPTLADDADPLYRPLDGLDAWASSGGGMVEAVDEGAWADAVGRLDDLRRRHPAWSDMVLRGARLAAAHQSGALDGVHGGGRPVATALLRSVTPAAEAGAEAWPHVRANDEALGLAAGSPVLTEDVIRRIHEVACRPQLTHRVVVDGRVQDHVFAHGDYKHHPNHLPDGGGGWRARAPVGLVGTEMRRLVEAMGSPGFSRLHVAARAAFVLHGVAHVAPFADGNGRTGRALAGALLLRAAGLPLLVPVDLVGAYDGALEAAGRGDTHDLVRFVADRSVDLARLLCGLPVPGAGSHDPAYGRWCAEVATARAVADALAPEVRRALARHRARTDLGWLSPLVGATVVPPASPGHEERVDAGPLTLVVPLPGGGDVEEVITVVAHPLDAEGGVVVRAREAQLRLDVALGESPEGVASRLAPWLDRAMSTLALRVAAELE
jgi:hypothetical protein